VAQISPLQRPQCTAVNLLEFCETRRKTVNRLPFRRTPDVENVRLVVCSAGDDGVAFTAWCHAR